MPKINPKEKRLVAIVSLALGIFMIAVALLSTFVFNIKNLPLEWDQFITLGMIVAIFPTAVTEFLDLRWERGIDKNIPRLLREIAESGKTGLTLIRAIEVSAERDYGPLTPELKHLVSQISWGVSLDDALRSFAKRARTKLAQRSADLIAEVSRSGGDTQEIMEQVNKHIGELQSMDRERYAQMRPYAVVVYIAFGVFLFTDVMLIRSFFSQIVDLQAKVLETQGVTGGGAAASIFGGASAMDITLLKKVLFHATVVQAGIGGLVAGKMSEAKLGAGLKHVVLLLIICFVAFFLFVWRG
jgi:flagellar protein FlaJ